MTSEMVFPRLLVSGVEYDEPVGKIFKLDEDGNLIKDKGERPPLGRALCRELTLGEYTAWRQSLGSGTILVAGNFESIDIEGKQIAYKSDADGIMSVSLSNDYLAHRSGPAILRIDIDTKRSDEVAGMHPETPKTFDTLEGVEAALIEVFPEAMGCGMIITDSSSAMIMLGDELIRGAGGYRIEIPVTDGTRIPDIIDHIHEACWAKGYGWSFVDGGGRIQQRSLVDEALKKPSQPDYAAPECEDELQQKRRWLVRHGDYLDPATITPISGEDQVSAATAKATAEAELTEIAATARAGVRSREMARAEKRGVKLTDKNIDDLLDRCILRPGIEIVFDDGEAVSVRDLLVNGEAHNDRICFDPIEPDYDGGRAVGKFFWNDGLRPGVHSFAHGQRWFSIVPDINCVIEMMAKEFDFEDDVSRVWSFSDMSEIEMAAAEKEAARRLGLGNQRKPIRKAIKKWSDMSGDDGSGEDLSPTQRDFSDRHFVLTQGDKVRVCRLGDDHELIRLSERDFILQEKNNLIPQDGKQVSIASWWLTWPERRTFLNGTGLYPNGAVPEGKVNLWRG